MCNIYVCYSNKLLFVTPLSVRYAIKCLLRHKRCFVTPLSGLKVFMHWRWEVVWYIPIGLVTVMKVMKSSNPRFHIPVPLAGLRAQRNQTD